MNTETVKRAPRIPGPPLPEGRVEMAEPPVLGEPAVADLGSMVGMLPMALGVGSTALMFSVANGSSTTYMMSGVMGASMVAMGAGQLNRNGGDRKRRMRAERRDYLRYLAQQRSLVEDAAQQQRSAVGWDNPEPLALWSVAAGPRLWERRPTHEDFARVRIGLGRRRAALEVVPPQTKPVEDLEPLCAVALRRFVHAHQTVSGVPVTVGLRNFTSVEFTGEPEAGLGLLRAMIGQLVTFHSPDELRIALLTDEEGLEEWDWLKWLPHTAHPRLEDAAGPLRLVATDHDSLTALLGPEFEQRAEHDPAAVPGPSEPFVAVVAHRTRMPMSSRLLGAGLRNAVLLDATGVMPGGPKVLRLVSDEGRVRYPVGDVETSARGDGFSRGGAESLARSLSPKSTGGSVDLADKPLESDFELTTLLGIRNPHTFDVAAKWRPRVAQSARLQVPIGVTENGEIVELDLKESAQGGMGPHGLLIGATGSGKSELLRTLIIGLAATHSSEILNFVLVDFKGGATFLNMDRLPHTSAVITNLAGELALVDRMRDAINGEVIRRQELLRESGRASLFEYEKARAAGAPLSPLPTLLVVVDEFSELLASKPEFIELFVTIGRVGRSLGVHLLLASQRLDEGRIHKVEGHLSYRMALRTFSSMESRSVIGVSSAYELPASPGNGFLKVDTTNLVRFKAAFVSGPCAVPDEARGGEIVADVSEAVPFSLRQRLPTTQDPVAVRDEPEERAAVHGSDGSGGPSSEKDGESLLEVLIDRLVGAGPPARQVWLPPLNEAPSLDQLLPGIVPHPERGLLAVDFPGLGSLVIPLGVVDRPFEQSRELLMADLRGAEGHVAVAGAPQTGKSTLLRTLMLALALTHSPLEVQIYCLDFGGGGLASVSGLPHVGSVATRLERDRVLRTVEEIAQLIEQRERRFTEHGIESMAAYRAAHDRGEFVDPYGEVFLVVDGWGVMRQDFEELEPRIVEIAARGLSFGVHLVVSAVRWSEIRSRTRDLMGTKFELRLGDAMESEVKNAAAKTVPHQPGRGITRGSHHFLVALPRLDGSGSTDDLTAATKAAAAEIDAFWSGPSVPEVRMLPTRLPASSLPKPEGSLRMCLGLDEKRLEPVWHDFAALPHLMVFGDADTGKTAALRLVIDAVTARYSPAEARILLADPGRGLIESVPEPYRVGYAVDTEALAGLANSAAVSMTARLPGAELSPERLEQRDWWTGPELFLIVDDYDLLVSGNGAGGPLVPLVRLLAGSVHIGMHVILARSTSGAVRSMMDPVLRRLWELGAPGLLLSYPKEEGKFLGDARPRTLPPGRAQLVTRRGTGLIQLGIPELDDRRSEAPSASTTRKATR
jgi:S-DNA-T family DNA segregation ATPase FtsK/SpoIIIE